MRRTWAVLAIVAAAGTACADEFFITQSVVPDVIIGGGIACSGDGGFTVIDTQWWRSFDLSSVNGGADINVMNIQFGVENSADPLAGGVLPPITINLYEDPTGGTILRAELDLLGTVEVDVPLGTFFFQDVASSIEVPGGVDLAVEIAVPELTPNVAFFLGSNNFGETGDSFISSASCGNTDPFTMAQIGFPGVHHLMHLTACESMGGGCYADCNGDTVVNIFDFLCFQGLVTNGDPAADCNGDGPVNIFDFLCFQGAVTKGC